MIFITVGSQKFQFNRLLQEVDKLVEKRIITEEVFAQTGYSDYEPKNYQYKNFLDRDEFRKQMKKCDKVITHGGTGAIIGAIKQKKKIIAVPRLKKYGEHVDDHQIQIVNQFGGNGFIISINEINKLEKVISYSDNGICKEYISNTEKIINSIELFLQNS